MDNLAAVSRLKLGHWLKTHNISRPKIPPLQQRLQQDVDIWFMKIIEKNKKIKTLDFESVREQIKQEYLKMIGEQFNLISLNYEELLNQTTLFV